MHDERRRKMNIKNIVSQIVSISCFNKGQAAKIFDRLKTDKQIVVVKNNNPVAVVMSIEEYQSVSEKLGESAGGAEDTVTASGANIESAAPDEPKAAKRAPKSERKFSVCGGEPKKQKCKEV